MQSNSIIHIHLNPHQYMIVPLVGTLVHEVLQAPSLASTYQHSISVVSCYIVNSCIYHNIALLTT